ncbi:unnamed protein product [Thlaspi arvense]|uniref:Uncharacterized protein n=1 Tax=Thlaspi arvense TaxID=13288 RepID=A0AAU9S0K1_THLAR|nr:unnamed protein product [Thlaspi arvense]
MTSATVDFGIGRILSLLKNETLLLSGVHGEIEKMKKELLIIKSFLEDTHKHGGNGSTTTTTTTQLYQTFVANTRDLAYKVEDIIDEFTYHFHSYRSCTKLWRAIHFPSYMWTRHTIAQKLRMVNVMIQSISESMKRYHRSENYQGASLLPYDDDDGGGSKWVNNISESSLFFSENSLVGIDAAKGKLIGWLLSPEPQRIVVSVVGMGGSGKTTLSANIFKSQSVRKHFGSYAWVTISKSYVIEDVFRTMIKEFYKEAETQIPAELYSFSYRELVEKLVGYLQSKRYFVVLDDVWSTGLWRKISIALPDGICGSRVMITTRSNNVASFSYGIGSRHHEIELLKEDEAWVLFCNKAFSGSLEQCRRRNLEMIARKLLERCQGLPLAIASLGSMMSTKVLESEWKKVYNSLNWELNNNLELKVVRSILLLSFNDLSYPLKRCFLYCSLFPVNYRMKRKRLVRMWMAQRFVEPIRGVKAEEVADGYLNELVYRNMLQVILWNPFGRPKLFKMHDVIREITLSISKDERFCDAYSNDNDDDAETTEDYDTRHLCIQREMRSGIVRTTNLHSLLVYTKHNIELPPNMKLLRALDLEDSGIIKLPDCLVTLFHLKYLNLSKTQVKELPRNFHKLVNLETLNTRHSKIEELPPGMSKLRKLRYLITFRCNYGHDSNWNYVLGIKVSPNIYQLKDLQVMDCFNAEAELIKNLGNMTQLTRLSLVMVRREHGSDLCESLNKIKGLRFLSLTSIHEEEPLKIDGLIATASIEKLFLAGKLETVPSWFSTLQNLTYLGLRGSQLQENAIRYIQALPKLVWLSFYNAYIGPRLCFAQGFHNLKILDVVHMQHLREVVIEDGAMFGLQKLYVRDCRGLESVPRGIENLVNIQELHLSHVSHQLVERIGGEGSVDRSRVKHIPAIRHHFRNDNGSFYVSLSS